MAVDKPARPLGAPVYVYLKPTHLFVMMGSMIGLMDCNNFFVSCERLFRPDLLARPVAVLSSNDGCIVARSQEVKDLGIPMGAPYFQVKKTCDEHHVTLFSSNFTLYRDLSTRVMAALRAEFDQIEVYSVDEAFFAVPLDYSLGTLVSIRERIIQKTGIPVSLGLGATKTIAKIASKYAKKETGVYVMDTARWELAKPEIECGQVWGIGRQITRTLRASGIVTVADFLACNQTYFRTTFGVVGERLFLELSGVAAYPLGTSVEVIQHSLTSSRSFAGSVFLPSALESALAHHLTHLGEKLRTKGWKATGLSVLVAPSRFSDYALRPSTAHQKLSEPTADTGVLIKVGLALFHTLYDKSVPYKRAGATVHGLVPITAVTPSLFAIGDDGRARLNKVIDTLNERYGTNAVQSAAILGTTRWRERSALKSPSYTTDWTQIPSIKAK